MSLEEDKAAIMVKVDAIARRHLSPGWRDNPDAVALVEEFHAELLLYLNAIQTLRGEIDDLRRGQ